MDVVILVYIQDLPNMDEYEDGSLSDPYVKIFFIPGNKQKIILGVHFEIRLIFKLFLPILDTKYHTQNVW